MPAFSRSLLSDNTGPGLPAVLQAIAAENALEGAPYGEDETTRRLQQRCAEFFEADVDVYPVATGIGANALAMSVVVPADGAIFCAPLAHMYQSEGGAVEFATSGARLVPAGQAAKLDAVRLSAEVDRLRSKGDASPGPTAVSISQATELGTVYEPEELRSISEVCGRHGLALHMDGARLFHALAATGLAPADITWRTGVDVLSLGMTKCGGLFGEAVVVFTGRLERRGIQPYDLKRRRLRSGHALGKMRFVSAQLLALLEQQRWRTEAEHANTMARQLQQVLMAAAIPLCAPVQTNQIFFELTDDVAAGLRRTGWSFRDWPASGALGRRFVASALTSPETVRALASDLARLKP